MYILTQSPARVPGGVPVELCAGEHVGEAASEAAGHDAVHKGVDAAAQVVAETCGIGKGIFFAGGFFCAEMRGGRRNK